MERHKRSKLDRAAGRGRFVLLFIRIALIHGAHPFEVKVPEMRSSLAAFLSVMCDGAVAATTYFAVGLLGWVVTKRGEAGFGVGAVAWIVCTVFHIFPHYPWRDTRWLFLPALVACVAAFLGLLAFVAWLIGRIFPSLRHNPYEPRADCR